MMDRYTILSEEETFPGENGEPVRCELYKLGKSDLEAETCPVVVVLRETLDNQGSPITWETVDALRDRLLERFHDAWIDAGFWPIGPSVYYQSESRVWEYDYFYADMAFGTLNLSSFATRTQYEVEKETGMKLSRSTSDYVKQSLIDLKHIETLTKEQRVERLLNVPTTEWSRAYLRKLERTRRRWFAEFKKDFSGFIESEYQMPFERFLTMQGGHRSRPERDDHFEAG